MSATVSDHRPRLGHGNDEPFDETDTDLGLTEATARRRFKLNYALIGVAMTLVGLAWKAEWTVADYAGRVFNLEESDKGFAKRVDGIDADRHEKIAQAEADRHERDERRIRLANDLGVVNSRLGLLEMQTKWLNDWVKDNGLLRPRK